MFNLERLKHAEHQFMHRFPGGFEHPEMLKVGKKHKMDKMVEMSQDYFSRKNSRNIESFTENMVKVVSRSSMVSMFEKPRFKDFVNNLSLNDKAFLVKSLSQLLHGKQQLGFEAMVDLLKTEKLAKWSLMTIIPAYYSPEIEVFVKPTTAKGVIKYLEISEFVYKSTPTWDFYFAYRALINECKQQVDESLSPSNAAFSGFLMSSI